MAQTEVRSGQIKNSTVSREDLNTITSGQAVISKAIAGDGVVLGSSGVDPGTGDVTISIASTLVRVWERKTANFTAEAGKGYIVDTSSAAITATLPASPNFGDLVAFVDGSGTWDTNNFTVARNGRYLMGLAEDMVVDIENMTFGLVWSNVTTPGWRIV